MFPKDWTARSLVIAGVAFLLVGAGFVAIGSITGDLFAWFIGLTTVFPAAAMLIDGIRRRRKTAKSVAASERS